MLLLDKRDKASPVPMQALAVKKWDCHDLAIGLAGAVVFAVLYGSRAANKGSSVASLPGANVELAIWPRPRDCVERN
jgi:hypothetical protein